MANAIKHISVEKGHDIKNHVLVGYGAAAGQHLCHIADVLDIKNILLHELAVSVECVWNGFAELKSIKTQT